MSKNVQNTEQNKELNQQTSDTNENSTQFDSKSFINLLPLKPGVYRMLGKDQEILYVGKAKNLKNRVGSYFRARGLNAKTVALVARIRNIEVTITHSETEALLLEQTLIKQHRPTYNILLMDDKGYPYIFLSDHGSPGLFFHRGSKKAKGQYFGPFPNVSAVRETLSVLQKAFSLRQCENSVFSNRSRPCLQYQIKRCKAPCVDLVSPDEYQQDVTNTRLFLEGKSIKVLENLEAQMDTAAQNLNYEVAASYRDQLLFLRKIQEQQFVAGQQGNSDIFAIELAAKGCCISKLVVRDGRVLGNRQFFPKTGLEEGAENVLQAFLGQYYFAQRNHDVPNEILTSIEISNSALFVEAFKQEFDKKVRFAHQVRAERKSWIKLAQTNATEQLNMHLSQRQSMVARMRALESEVGLEPKEIQRMECFDISHTMGEATQASCVVFDENGPVKAMYRRFNIENITPGDDYAAMEQALTRRYAKLMKSEQPLPDVLIVDGGKGQLGIGRKVLEELGITTVLLLGIAKGEGRKAGLETVYVNEKTNIMHLDEHAPAFHLLQHIRDEAHRFAITGHRGKRQKQRTGSLLDAIPGVGGERRKALIRHFGSAKGVQAASADEIGKVRGISQSLAENIYEYLHN